MTKWLLVPIAAVAAYGALASAPRADAPIRDTQQVSETFRSGFWSRACGFRVLRTDVGTFTITVHTAADGSHAREQDSFNRLTSTLSAPSTGRSFEDKFGPVQYEYPDGIYLGAPALVISVGPELKVPGLPPDAGRVVSQGEIVFVDQGIPFVDFDPTPISSSGHFNDPAAVVAAGCAALAGP